MTAALRRYEEERFALPPSSSRHHQRSQFAEDFLRASSKENPAVRVRCLSPSFRFRREKKFLRPKELLLPRGQRRRSLNNWLTIPQRAAFQPSRDRGKGRRGINCWSRRAF